MDPERGPEPEPIEFSHHPLGVREFVRFKLCVTVTTLPVVINLKVAVIEPVVDNVPKRRYFLNCIHQKGRFIKGKI